MTAAQQVTKWIESHYGKITMRFDADHYEASVSVWKGRAIGSGKDQLSAIRALFKDLCCDVEYVCKRDVLPLHWIIQPVTPPLQPGVARE